MRQTTVAVVHANIRSEDWLTSDRLEVRERTLASLDAEGGGIILLHDGREHTVEALDALLTEIETRGYHMVGRKPRPRLADLGKQHGIRVGSVMFPPSTDDRRAWRRAVTEFDVFTLPAFFRLIRPSADAYDFTIPDGVANAAPPGTAFRVHNLIWCEQLPEWFDSDLTGPELETLLVDHVRTVVEHYERSYPGRVIGYDVVNEPLSWTGKACPWHRIGLEANNVELHYVRLALETARQAGPHAKLFLNDFGIERKSERGERMLELAKSLIDEGVPLDGVGLQAHFTVEGDGLFGHLPPQTELARTMRQYAMLGLEVAITEADVAIADDSVDTVSLQDQAETFARLARCCVEADSCTAFVTWGIGDADSWIPRTFPGWGTPLLFDAEYAPKRAYAAVLAAFRSE